MKSASGLIGVHFFYALKNVRTKDESQNSAYCKQLCLLDELDFNSY
jgi:hypothetical protein